MKKILIIEDELAIQEIIKDYFENQKFEVIVARDGKEGLYQAIVAKPDVVICDVMMPKMNGYEVVKHIRQHEEISNLPIIMLTARAEHADIREGMRGGADDYLTKPFKFEELLEAVYSGLKKNERLRQNTKYRIRKFTQQMQQAADHEFNTPLNTIFGFSEIIIQQASGLSKEKIVEFTKKILTSGKRLQRTVKKMAIYQSLISRPEDEVFGYIGSSNIYSKEIRLIINRFSEETLAGRSIKIQVDMAIIAVSEIALDIIIYELVDNAIKFSTPQSEVLLTGEIKENVYQLKVRNEGYGMSSKEVDEIDAFVQFNRSHYEQQGSGLGLFIVRSLVVLNGGKFVINSVEKEFLEVIIDFGIEKQCKI